ncbi:MAG TPA: 2-amino-4-oxopentanoate thiolase subunit OrtB [Bacillota bacterium]|nr:2-amino-4-oxopentanoate thiolase subunit OrtB [Bacillota bacterium]HPZ91063.1 2-amino-4-oxopentanoate thiolase subunit OrtB [Bacillota bacterium]HQE01902.1 2-amino-4-oxopentanoate thiolase subunit OrtB [Bacillota bacterium]
MKDNSYQAVMARSNDIMKQAVGIDYTRFVRGRLAFDYQAMMTEAGYSLDEVAAIQQETGVGNTPLYELRNITRLVRLTAPKGKGARIFLKDEAANPSGSFKARRAALSVYHAAKHGYKGVVAATSGNYGAAVASQAAARGLKCIVIQEAFDSRGVYQPEIAEKGRACEAYGAEVLQLSVGPELFYVFLRTLEETGFFNASLYTPFAIAGVETLGWEIARQMREKYQVEPDVVVVTHAGGGNLTGTARGLRKAGCRARVVAASVDLRGLHMASDADFNRKSFTTGHTGFGVPFATWPDRADVPRNAARPLRYMDRYVTVTQGEAFYVTELLAQLEGLERGPAGNISLAAAMALAREMDRDQVVVVQETEYTGAGKHVTAQLSFARQNGIEVRAGDPADSVPGRSIILPEHPGLIRAVDIDLDGLRRSYIKNALAQLDGAELTAADISFLAEDCRCTPEFVQAIAREVK